ncbi:MAG: ATP-binding protein [Vicinamibacterales bacterium]
MSVPHTPLTLRGKLAIWLTLVLVAALALYSGVAYVSLRQVLWHELDERLHNDIETLEGLLQPFWTPQGVRASHDRPVLDDDDYRWMQVWSPDGRLLFSSSVAASTPVAGLAHAPSDRAVSLHVEGGVRVRVKEESGRIAGHPVIVRVLTSEARVEQELAEFFWLIGLAAPLVVGVAVLGGYHLVRRTLRPVDRLVEAANQITADRLNVRLPVVDPGDEVGQIARAFNATLAKLEESFDQMRRFTANASHELRTPLTALRSTGQAALAANRGDGHCREALVDMIEDAEQLSRLVDAILLLAQADNGAVPLERRSIDVDRLVTDVAKECEVLAQEKGQRLLLDCAAGRAEADPTVLRIAIANLLHNAIRYGPPASAVGVRAFGGPASVTIEVRDSGPGIAPEHHEHLFERFYRVDPGRSSALGGAGLGLAMTRWSVEAHGGTVAVASAPGVGSTFRIALPRTPPSRNPERLDS